MMSQGLHLDLVALAILAAFIAYSLLSRAINRSILTLPIIFMCLGYALSEPLRMAAPPQVLDEGKRLLAEITLVLVLFADASHVQFSQLKQNWKLPARMLVIGLPLSILLGTLVTFLVSPEGGIAMALLTAAVLTPTDAALAQGVVTNASVPDELSETINVESGLNDGLVLPFVLLGAILASAGMMEAKTDGLAANAVTQIVLGPLAGIATGWVVARLMDMAQSRRLIAAAAEGVVFVAASFAAYVLAEVIGGNGFIAAFVAGMIFGNSYRHNLHFVREFMDGAGQILTMSSFLVFGALLLPEGLAHASVKTVVIAVLFLTLVRVGAIWLSLLGSGLKTREKLFLGWFGPRGLASILFTLVIMDEFDFPNEAELLACVAMTVALSILAHGLSSTPLAKWIGKR
ncbi:sodium/proton antiporter, CPA1 family [Hoeflea sp. IMCC20628]|uniref:cation:proton antiporter n=1 Tax=Hoeflea sp. IMCC20628 TaxID=1620421 RepID=UPI00063BD52C|nr:cation:proton antiporter [Hoeflea sp. IMCC20628]AKI00406.1 sodium/proton antiporter, CPA1 family [Hoeflea sp. IMCC20628]